MASSRAIKKPSPLKQGDWVSVIAPASPFDREAFAKGVERIRRWGFQVKYREDIFARNRYLAGPDERRAEEFIEALQDPVVRAVFTARGGYGSQRLLPAVEKLPNNLTPKILVGYSDITSLMMYAGQHWGWVTFHGPVVSKDISDRLGSAGEKSLLRVLTDPTPLGTLQPEGVSTLMGGKATGTIVGGCLSLVVCSLGTPWQLKTKGSILFLEDVGELLYSLDRMLTQLRLAGLFEGIRGIVFGPLKDAHDEPTVIQEMLREVLSDLNVPMIFNFPSGHTHDSWTIPLGLEVTLDADAGSLTFEESALSMPGT